MIEVPVPGPDTDISMTYQCLRVVVESDACLDAPDTGVEPDDCPACGASGPTWPQGCSRVGRRCLYNGGGCSGDTCECFAPPYPTGYLESVDAGTSTPLWLCHGANLC